MGTSLYQASYLRPNGVTSGSTTLTKVGGGWDRFSYVEQSDVGARTARYGLRDDGTLFRWTNGWKTVSSYPGFSSVKTMALLSQTASYDSFLATTRGGALYTIRVPLTGAAVVKKVRASTWQGFEHLVLEHCGRTGTLLTAIDAETSTGYVYAVGHGATVIQGLGKVPTAFKDPGYFRDNSPVALLNGE
jgi:hypothetical protein